MQTKISKNQPCYCGSGKKYKVCCMVELPEKLFVPNHPFNYLKKKKELLRSYLEIHLQEEALPIIKKPCPRGLRSYILYRLEQVIFLLKEPIKNKNAILSVLNDLYHTFYSNTLKEVPNKIKIIRELNNTLEVLKIKETLSESEQILLINCVEGCLLDFSYLPQETPLDYDALRISCEFTKSLLYQIVPEDKYLKSVVINIDSGDTITDWEIIYSDKLVNNISIEYKSKDNLENEYKKLLSTLFSFSDDSKKILATAYADELSLNLKSQQLRSYNGLAMNFLGVIEQELKTIILKKANTHKRYMWKDITDFIKNNRFEILHKYLPNIHDELANLHLIRNKVSHGELISYEEYAEIKEFCVQKRGLEIICWEKAGEVPPKYKFGLTNVGLDNGEKIKYSDTISMKDTSKNRRIEEKIDIEHTLGSKQKKFALTEDEQLYEYGFELYAKGNYEESIKYFEDAAQMGNISSKIKLGFIYSKGNGVKSNPVIAFKWFMDAADKGDSVAQWAIGCCYNEGSGVEQNFIKAFDWYLKSAKNEQNPQRESAYTVGMHYNFGIGTTRNYKRAAVWYKKAAELGHTIAQYNLANLYLDGKGVEKDNDKAYYWFLKSAEQGLVEAIKNIDYMLNWMGYKPH